MRGACLELLEEGSALLLPGVSGELPNVSILLGSFGDELLVVMVEVGGLKVLAKSRIEDGELCDAVAEAETLSHREEGQVWLLVGADAETVLVEGLTHVAQDIALLTVLILAVERVVVKSLLKKGTV